MSIKSVLIRVALMVGGLLAAIACIAILFVLFPGLVPGALRGEERQANVRVDITYRLTDGDIFYNFPGEVKPPEQDAVLSQHVVETDDNGFRLPYWHLATYEEYPIVALGDSYTDAWMVASPWTDLLAEALDTPVLNLGYRGYGPMEYAAMFKEFGSAGHDWVLIAYFEGNDLENIRDSVRDARTNTGILSQVREAFVPDAVELVESDSYRYPLGLFIGDDYYEMAFFDPYLWSLNGEPSAYRNSRNVALFDDKLREIMAGSGDACVGVVYIPSKPHIYFPFAEPFGRQSLLEGALQLMVTDDGWLNFTERYAEDFDVLVGRFDHQRDVIGAVVQDAGAVFIDLTPAFQDAALRSEINYLIYDTHWNQDGHRLAAQTIAAAMEGVACE